MEKVVLWICATQKRTGFHTNYSNMSVRFILTESMHLHTKVMDSLEDLQSEEEKFSSICSTYLTFHRIKTIITCKVGNYNLQKIFD